MAVSKRVRFEVLRRDGHTCRYCGASAPDVKIQVDHVIPVALGGTDTPENLVAACADCNTGKASTSPDEHLVVQVSEETLLWAHAIKVAAAELEAEYVSPYDEYEWFIAAWGSWDRELSSLPDDWANSLNVWMSAGLSRSVLLDCHDTALGARHVKSDGVFAYMGGCAKRRIAEIQERAKTLIDGPPLPEPSPQHGPLSAAYWRGHTDGWNEAYEDAFVDGVKSTNGTREGGEPSPLAHILAPLQESGV